MKIIYLLMTVVLTSSIQASEYLELSKKIARLRAQVEQVNLDISEIRDIEKSKLRSYSLEQAEFDASIRKKEVENKQLKDKLKQLKEKIAKSSANNKDLSPIVKELITKLKNYIRNSIPFKQNDRLDNLVQIEQKLISGQLSSSQAMTRLWSSLDDEKILNRDMALVKETVIVDEKSYFISLIKIGGFGMVFKINDDKYGKIYKQDGTWHTETSITSAQKVAIDKLYDGFEKQIKTAQYDLPNIFEFKKEL